MATMTEHENVARLRAMLTAFNEGDIERYLSFWADDPVVHSGGASLVSGTFRGRDAVLGIFQKVLTLTEGTAEAVPLDVLADDRFGVVPMRATAQRAGKQLDVTLAIAYRADDQGLWQEAWFLADDQRAWDEFFQ